jgi:hypothetical protein
MMNLYLYLIKGKIDIIDIGFDRVSCERFSKAIVLQIMQY